MSDTAPIPPVAGPPTPPKDPLIGAKVGDFVIESVIAAGGMGIVYRARQPILGKSAAVKVLREEYARDDEQVGRFLKEAQTISAVHHRGIIDTYTFGHLPDGRQYMVMEYLDGETLEAVLMRDAPLPPARALPILDEILDALSAAHKVGVVHRDLKPSNVFITRESSGTRYAKLMDFGLAKQTPVQEVLEGREAKASLVAGTPEYISPEQARGLVATPRTDLYCFGVMAFEVLTGKLPFGATTVDGLLKQHVYDAAPRMSALRLDIPEALDQLVAQLLEKDADNRPQSADVVRQVLARVMKQLQTESTRQAVAPLPRKEAPIDAPATGQMRAEPSASSRPTAPRTDIIARSTDEQLKLVKRDRSPLLIGLLIFFLGGGLLAVSLWPSGEAQQAEKPKPPPVTTGEPTRVEPEPVVNVAPPAQPRVEDPLVPLDPNAAKPKVAPVVAPVKAEPVKPTVVVVNPPAQKIASVGCEPTDGWKKSVREDLQKLSSLAAKKDAPWSEDAEAALSKRIDVATSSNECASVTADFEAMRKAVLTH